MALIMENSKPIHEAILRMVYDCLKKTAGNKTKTAAELGVSLRCLRKWVAKYDELKEFRKSRTR